VCSGNRSRHSAVVVIGLAAAFRTPMYLFSGRTFFAMPRTKVVAIICECNATVSKYSDERGRGQKGPGRALPTESLGAGEAGWGVGPDFLLCADRHACVLDRNPRVPSNFR
jgi:hypothetical protein